MRSHRLAVDAADHVALRERRARDGGRAARADTGDDQAAGFVEVASAAHRRRHFSQGQAERRERALFHPVVRQALRHQRDLAALARTIDAQRHGGAHRQLGQSALQRRHVHRLQRAHGFALQREDAVAGQQPGLFGGRAALHRVHQHAFRETGALERAQAEAQVGALDPTLGHQGAHHFTSVRARDGKGQVAAEQGAARVHADDAARQVHQRAAGIARCNGRVVLDPGVVAAGGLVGAEAVFVVGFVVEQRHQQAARVVHHAGAHRIRQAPGRAHRQHRVAGLQVEGGRELGVSEGFRRRRQGLQHRQVGQRVGAHQARGQFAAVGEHHAEAAAVLGDVGVGGDVALRRHHGAAAAGHAEHGLALAVVFAHREDAHHHRQHSVARGRNARSVARAHRRGRRDGLRKSRQGCQQQGRGDPRRGESGQAHAALRGGCQPWCSARAKGSARAAGIKRRAAAATAP